MSREKVEEILSHVDMTKIDLSSFKLSEKKFNELSHLYRNRVVLSCVSIVVNKERFTDEEVEHAFKMVNKVAENPNFYDYATIYATERQSVDDAIDEITLRRDRGINDVKLKAIEKRMKDAYKQMRKTIEAALANGNSFEEEFNEETVERCIKITQNAINNNRQKVEDCSETTCHVELDSETDDQTNNVQCEIEEDNSIDLERPKTKVKFWQRLFSRV